MATGIFTYNALHTKMLTTLKKTYRKDITFKLSMHYLLPVRTGQILLKYGLP